MTSLEERQESRRRQMLDAGIALLGGPEAGALGVRAVCRSTGITERYFYEAFGTRDGFAHAVYDDIAGRTQDVLVQGVRRAYDAAAAAEEPVTAVAVAEAAVVAFVEFVIDRPDVGRILLLAPYRESVLAERGLGSMPAFFDVVAAAMPGVVDGTTRRLVATGLVGALTTLFTEYIAGRLDVTRQQLVDHCVRLIATAPDRFVDEPRTD
ncbi:MULTISPECIES: TetR/AcrR family transcriptional regulator [Tsukamurella]|uniref:TetR/AcrR family transcriptional regulator n=2 Tax=Tsukamurella TaxID=2060 RepID=A0A5C5S5Q8_9ACTN|nr:MULTISPECIES: TetR/AcrR family transcriptional regulator [Tsukamurella]NMD56903.1 TetR/AcrR family transcriptional regulator [Tsukamurella columbiensis]TWS29805.1 TetR/AcrR family transcriptional regulator [Tsukamurella conjunctivitidis]